MPDHRYRPYGGYDQGRHYDTHSSRSYRGSDRPRIQDTVERRAKEIDRGMKILSGIREDIPNIDKDLKNLEIYFNDLKSLNDEWNTKKDDYWKSVLLMRKVAKNIEEGEEGKNVKHEYKYEEVEDAYKKDEEIYNMKQRYNSLAEKFNERSKNTKRSIERLYDDIQTIEKMAFYRVDGVEWLAIRQHRDQFQQNFQRIKEKFQAPSEFRELSDNLVDSEQLDDIGDWLKKTRGIQTWLEEMKRVQTEETR